MEKICSLMIKKFDGKCVYGDKYIKAKIKIMQVQNVRINIPKESTEYRCLSLVMLSSVKKSGKKYPQTFLEECKYEIKKNKKQNLINDNLEPSLSDS